MNDIVNEDYYFEKGLLVMTARYHLKRGYCCGSGCRHCPYDPRHTAGTIAVAGQPSCLDDQQQIVKEKDGKTSGQPSIAPGDF